VICSSIPSTDPMYGQDGHYEQSTYGQHFYTDHGDGTVTDEIAGLMWQKCSAGLSGAGCTTGTAATYNWYEATGTADATYNPGGAVDYCGDLTTGGYTDWCLPDYHELLGIADYGQYNPAIDTVAFPGTPSSDFWSSSYLVSNPDYAWYVYFHHGHVYDGYKTDVEDVRCVRGGPYPVEPSRFDVSGTPGQEIVLDNETGLTWQKEYETGKNWPEALGLCEGLSYGGFDDWRLPSINELRGLVNIETHNPASDFPDMPSTYFLSSSSDVDYLTHAWLVNFYSSVVGLGFKTNDYTARCVRGGP
jgi:uncharacterized protein DUF1566